MNAGGNTTTGLGFQPASADIVVKTDETLPVEVFSTPSTRSVPVPEMRRMKKRSDGVVSFTHSHGDLAVPAAGIWAAREPARSATLLSPATMLAFPPHDHPDAPFSNDEPGNGTYGA